MNIAYLRVSTEKQDADNQRLAILDYANANKLAIDEFKTYTVSTRKSTEKRGITQLMDELESGDSVIVAELSRLGRSISEIIRLIDDLVKKHIGLIAIKEAIKIPANGATLDLQTKITVTLFALLGEIERDLISQRTRDAIRNAQINGTKSGKPVGRPKGSYSSHLDPHADAIKKYLELGISQSSIAKLIKAHPNTLNAWIKRQNSIEKLD